MNGPHTSSDQPPFGEFLYFLRRQGFAVGVDHYWRVYALAEKLWENCHPDEAKTVLCPIFATSKAQQEEFYQAFDAFFAGLRPSTTGGAPTVGTRAVKETHRVGSSLGWLRRYLKILALLALATTLIIIVSSVIVTGPGQTAIVLILPPDPSLSVFERHFRLIMVALSSVLCVGYLLYEWRGTKRQTLALHKTVGSGQRFRWHIPVDFNGSPVYDVEEFLAVARLLKRHEAGNYHQLNIPATIAATLKAADYPVLRYKLYTRVPEYLALIDRASPRDHRASLFDELVKRLSEEGVHLTRYFFDGDPRVCYSETGHESISLENLSSRFPNHRLLVFGTGEKMFEPLTGRPYDWLSAFWDWKLRLLLTPRPAALWGAREVLLSPHFIVLPATIRGLLSLSDYFETGQIPSPADWPQEEDGEPPPDTQSQAVAPESLRRYLGEELFQWLCACAYNPTLQWDLTLYLGSLPCMDENLLTETNLLKLTSLGWLQEGSIPNNRRALLIKELDGKKKAAVHLAIVELLEKHLSPQEAEAWSTRQFEIESGRPQPRGQTARGAQPGESTVLSLLNKALRLAVRLPSSLYGGWKAYVASEDEVADEPQAPTKASAAEPRANTVGAAHPKGLYVLFAAEMWERFSFYSMLAMFALYMRDTTGQGFAWSVDNTQSLVSNYLMFVYASPLVGGWIADKKLGHRKSVTLGGFFFMIGYALLTFRSVGIIYAALACLVIGNGFFKPNVSAMVGNLYPEGSHLKDRAYSIFYMGINVGAFTAPVVMELVQSNFGYHPAFAVAAGGMIFSVFLLWKFRRLIEAADRPEGLRTRATAGAGAVAGGHTASHRSRADVNAVTALVDARPDVTVRPGAIDAVSVYRRIAALVVVFLIVIVFWMVFRQNSTTITYWGNENTDWKVSGIISNSINPFWVITLTFPLVLFWSWLDKRGLEPSTPMKMVIGMVMTAAAFFVLFVAAKFGEASLAAGAGPYAYKMSPLWLLGAYGVLTLGELMLSPMGLSLVSKVAPVRMRGLMMGGWFVATAIGNKLTQIGQLWDDWLHSTFWIFLSACSLIIAFALLLLLRPLKKAMPGA